MLLRVDGEFASDYGANSNHKRDPNEIRWALSALGDIQHVFLKNSRQ